MATIPRSKRFRKTDDLEDKAMKMRMVADSSANLLEMKDVEFASVPVHIIVGGYGGDVPAGGEDARADSGRDGAGEDL